MCFFFGTFKCHEIVTYCKRVVFLEKLEGSLQVHKLLRGSHARMWTIRLRLHGKALNSKALSEEGDNGSNLIQMYGNLDEIDPPQKIVHPSKVIIYK